MENVMNQPEWSKVAEVELVYKTKVKASERPQVKTSHDGYEILKQIYYTRYGIKTELKCRKNSRFYF